MEKVLECGLTDRWREAKPILSHLHTPRMDTVIGMEESVNQNASGPSDLVPEENFLGRIMSCLEILF